MTNRNPYDNPYYSNPSHPNFNRRSIHHNYTWPAKYLITILKTRDTPPFSTISGTPVEPAVTLSNIGLTIKNSISKWQQIFKFDIPSFIIMPDHIHLCVAVKATLPGGLSRAIAKLKGMITTANPQTNSRIFEKGFNDRIARSSEQWERQCNYTNDNPRRLLIKRLHPDFLLRRWLLILDNNRKFILQGNIFLLKQPRLFRVKTSRKYSSSERANKSLLWQNELISGSIPISPFIHVHERELREEAIRKGYAYIRICTNGLNDRERAYGKEFDLMAEGRILLIAPYEFESQKSELKYDYAQSLNKLAEDIASACNSGISLSLRAL